MSLMYPIETLKKELDELNKHRMFNKKPDEKVSPEEELYHVSKIGQVLNAIKILQIEHNKTI